MSSRQGIRGEKNSGGDRDSDRGGDGYGNKDQYRDGTRRKDEDTKGSDRKDRRDYRDQREKKSESRDYKETGGGRRDDNLGDRGSSSRRDTTRSDKDSVTSGRRDGERGGGRIFRDRDRERELERDRQERGYGSDRRGYKGGRRDRDYHRRDRDGRDRDLGHDGKRPIILAKPPTAGKEKDLEKHRDEEFPTLQQAHHRDSATKSPPPAGAATTIDGGRTSEDRLVEVGKLLLGRHDSIGKSQLNNSGAGGNQYTGNVATPPKSTSPRPAADDTSHHTSRTTDTLNMDDPPFRDRSVRLVDDLQQFSMSGLNAVLTDNTDFLVVGVIGMQGTGKSSMLNYLANHVRQKPNYSTSSKVKENKENETANNTKSQEKSKSAGAKLNDRNNTAAMEGSPTETSSDLEEIFREQSFEKQMLAEHCTSGIKAWISPTTRVIFLDSQPLNSMSVLDRAMQLDKKHMPEYVGTMEATVEIQSLQIVGFLSMVCHVLLAVQDHFVDTCLIELLHTSNMLRPAAHACQYGPGTDEGTNGPNSQQQIVEYFPELIFVHNKAHLDDFTPRRIQKMQKFYSKVMTKQSQVNQINWRYDTGIVRMTKVMSHLTQQNCSGMGQNVNLFILPDLELSDAGDARKAKRGSNGMSSLPEISFEKLTAELRRRILAIPPRPLNTLGKLSEKSWLNHAQKSWESIKASSFYVEYGRILTG